MHRAVAEPHLAVAVEPGDACASSSSRRRARENPRAHGRRGFPVRFTAECSATTACASRLSSSSASTRSLFQIIERSVMPRSASRRPTSSILRDALLERLGGAEHGAVVLHDALHVERGSRRSCAALARGARGRAARAPASPAVRRAACAARRAAPARPCASAAARPNTTMSSSELQPSRLAPCTETQAASPIAIRPGTTRSGSSAVGSQHLAVIIGRDAAHVVMHGRQRPGSARASRRRRRKSSRSRRCPAGARAAPWDRDARDAAGCGPCAGRSRGPSRISMVMARLTTSREARSLACGA